MVQGTLKPLLDSAGAVWATTEGRPTVSHFGDTNAEYQAITSACGLADFSDRTQIEMTGSDRAAFLHNLCTNEIRKLPPGAGCEAFVTDVKGKIVAYVNVFCRPDSLVLESVPEQAERLIAHLDRYLINEDVELHDRSDEWAELLLAGPLAGESLSRATAVEVPSERLANVDAEIAGYAASLRRVDVVGPEGFLIGCPREHVAAIWQALRDAGAIPCGQQAVETARIEYGTPLYGVDVTDANLPQEVDRDREAISFVKGCYLGQETVARIDAMGHVNRKLRGVRFHGNELPEAGMELSRDGKPVGEVTSATFSPRLDAPLAMAYLRRENDAASMSLDSPLGEAEVVALPLPSPK